MTNSLEAEERRKYEHLWGKIPEYRETSSADLLTPLFLQYYQSRLAPNQRVIDFGCGPGRSAIHLLKAGLEVELIDFAKNCLDPEIVTLLPRLTFNQACLWDLPTIQPAEWGICFDVLEHIPTDKIPDVLANMARVIKNGCLVAIDLTEDRFGQTLHTKLHLTLKPTPWWLTQIEPHFKVENILLDDINKLLISLTKK